MKAIVTTCVQRCGHDGLVANIPSQTWVRVAGSPALIKPDPVGRAIAMCPNYGVNIKPCTSTLVVHRGYSGFVRIDGRALCLDIITGYTDGTPPGVVTYTVRSPGQGFVEVMS